MTIRNMLDITSAFYNRPDYEQVTKSEFAQKELLPVSYTYNTESRPMKCLKEIISCLYNSIHAKIGNRFVLPASKPEHHDYPATYAHDVRQKLPKDDWKYRRFTLEVDGYKIDAAIIGKSDTLSNGRWTLCTNGNLQFYEEQLHGNNFKQVLTQFKSNAIVFNYPGVGASTGPANQKGMVKAYQAMLKLLEDKEKGIGAKEIIGFGHSVGGGVQGAALKGYAFNKEVKYVFIKSRTFSSLYDMATRLTNSTKIAKILSLLGWNLDSLPSSKELAVPEIILQTANVEEYELLKDSSKIISDGVIPAEVSLAKKVLDDESISKQNKRVIGIPEGHNDALSDIPFLAKQVEVLLKV